MALNSLIVLMCR